MAYILVTYGGAETRYPVKASVTHIGRALDNDIVLNDIKASRKHCQILYTRQGFKVVDLNSNNGTKIGEAKIHEHLLATADVIVIGSTRISVVSNAPATATSQPAQASPEREAAEIHSVQTMVMPSAQATPGPQDETKAVPVVRPPDLPAVAPHQDAKDETPQAGTPAVNKEMAQPFPGKTKESIGQTTTSRGRRSLGKTSMTSRLVHESRRKKMNPWVKLGIVVGGIAVALLLVLLLKPTPVDVPRVLGEIEALESDAQKLSNTGKFEEAAKTYEEILAKYQSFDKADEGIKNKLSYIRRSKEEAEGRVKLERDGAAAVKEIEDLLKSTEGLASKDRLDPLREADKKGQEAKAKYRGTTHENKLLTLSMRVQSEIQKLGKLRDQWDKLRLEARERANGRDKDYAQAMKRVREFLMTLAETGDNEETRTIKNEVSQLIEEINGQAKIYVSETLSRNVRNKVEDNKKEEALAYLQDKKEKIAGTDAEPLFDELLKSVTPQ